MQLICIRHGAAEGNVEGRFLGHSNPPLTEEGIEHAHRAAEKLKEYNLKAIYCSDLLRSHQTAEIVHQDHDCALIVNETLRESNHGVLDGLIGDELETHPDFIARAQDKYHFRPTGGESYADVEKRLRPFFEELKMLYDENEQVLIVSHMGVMRVIRKIFTNCTPEEATAVKFGHDDVLIF
ncbi:MAG: hypothetical protein CMH30_07135 [Micavibrio sp.]|nr:hypothetical protein [Micavibrio sp.]|tara:strand:- start:259 stop:801 length:543 start_codon:yes stop_codon:yes gene_type:complete